MKVEIQENKETDEERAERLKAMQNRPRVQYDLTTISFEKSAIEQEKERIEKLTEKTSKEEYTIDRRKREIVLKAKQLIANSPPPPKYVPLEPVTKSAKLKELEQSIKKGDFFTADHKKYITKNRRVRNTSWKEQTFDYKNTFDSVGISRHLLWKSVV